MRSTKLISAFAALVLAFSLVGFVSTPAQAAKPKHELVASGGKKPSGQLYIYGQTATAPNKKVIIKKRLKGKSAYNFYKNGPTTGKGKFSVNVNGKIGDCFSITVPASGGYKAKTLAGKRFCIVPA